MASLVELWARVMVAITWQLAAVVVLALVCERLLRLREPRVRHALWWFVVLAPLLLAPARLWLAEGRAQMRVTVPASAVAALDLGSQVRAGGAPWEGRQASAFRSPPAAALRRNLPAALAALWLAGYLVLVLRLTVGHWRARRMVAAAAPVTEGKLREALSELCRQAGIGRRVELRTSRAADSAMLYGVIRPVIVLPQEWLARLEAEHLRSMLAHEVAHVQRRDVLWYLVQRAVEAMLFFHPGQWLAGRRIALAREELCDDWALRQGATRSGYARTLAIAAEQAQPRLGVAAVGLAESRCTLLTRVEAIMRGAGTSRISRLALLALVAAVVGVAVAVAAVQLHAQSPAGGDGGGGAAHSDAAPGGGGGGRVPGSILSGITLADLDPTQVRSYQVSRGVSSYPDREDLSGPEQAYVTINRAIARGDQEIWSRISPPDSPLASGGGKGLPPEEVHPEKAAQYRGAEISEVWIYQGRTAGVIAHMDLGAGRSGYDIRLLELRDGRWLNRGESVAPTLELARNVFARCASGPQLLARLTEEATAEAMARPAQFAEMARKLFQGIRTADYRSFLTTEPETWPEFPADYMVATDHTNWVRWICTTFGRNPIVDVQLGTVVKNAEGRPTVPYRLTLKDGSVLAGDLPFYVDVMTGTPVWQAGTGLDWHLQEKPLSE